jgi:hypothetical protein
MTKRRAAWAGVAIVVVLLGAVWLAGRLLLPKNGPINPDSYARIHEGMSYDEVIDVLGLPHDGVTGHAGTYCSWTAPSGYTIHVWLGPSDTVTSKETATPDAFTWPWLRWVLGR